MNAYGLSLNNKLTNSDAPLFLRYRLSYSSVYICAFAHACSVSDYVCAEVEVGRVPGFVITKSLIHATN